MGLIDAVWKKLPFRKAIDWFLKKVVVPTERWDSIDREMHDHAFVIAGLQNAQILDRFKGKVREFIEEGKTLEDFRKEFEQIATETGWEYNGSPSWRSKIIALTNARTSYSAGRFQQMEEPELKAARPFREYRHGGSAEPRQKHISVPPFGWNGLILRADDPWWNAHFPPNGFGCSCKVFSLSERDLERLGKRVNQAPQDGFYRSVDRVTGQERLIPNGIDPGWDYTPGRSPEQERERIYQDILGRLSPELRSQAEVMIRQHRSLNEQAGAGEAGRGVSREEAPSDIGQAERRIRKGSIEISHVFEDGRWLFGRVGDASVVGFSEEERRQLPGKTVIHNHPGGTSFSKQDLDFFLANLVAELRVVTDRYRYSISLPSNPPESFGKLQKLYYSVTNEIRESFKRDLALGIITYDEGRLEFMHTVWLRLSQELEINYRREELEDD